MICDPLQHRREFLATAGGLGLTWLGTVLARAAEDQRRPARSVIVLWLAGGPSQLETFDPKPGTEIAAGSRARDTAVKGVQLGSGFEQLADLMADVALVRSLTSPEGDHERGTYTVKTGYRPEPTLVHPSLGAVVCHAFAGDRLDIPRHISILPNQWPARGGFLGAEYDAFQVFDPARPVPDVTATVPPDRFERRQEDLAVVDAAFVRGRENRALIAGYRETAGRAVRMMSSEQLRAFDLSQEPLSVRREYGETPFGRGCLAARRLIEAGVRCVEVTLEGWDTHANNHEQTAQQVAILDPAFSALLRDLKRRDLLKDTVVLCLGEFGRTPRLNPLGGRDHWPHSFAAAVAGGGLRGGVVVGESDPEGGKNPKDPVTVPDLYATLYQALGIDWQKPLKGTGNRPVKRSTGRPIAALLS